MRQTFIVLLLLVLSLSFVSAATVTGKVVGMDGKPIKGANVLLYLYNEQNDRKPLDLLTDAEGGFSADTDLTSSRRTAILPVLSLMLRVVLGRHLHAESAGQRHHPQRGNPRSAVRWWIKRANRWPAFRSGWSMCRMTKCRHMTIAPACRKHGVHVSRPPRRPTARGHCPAYHALVKRRLPSTTTATCLSAGDPLVAEEKTAPIQLTARPGAVITGRVLTPEGTPAASARINVYAPDNPSAPSGYGKTAATAAFASPGWRTDSYTISVNSEEQAWVAEPLRILS